MTYPAEYIQAARDAVRVGSAILRGDAVTREAVPVNGPVQLTYPQHPVLEFGSGRVFRITAVKDVLPGDAMQQDREIRLLAGIR